MGLKGDQLVCKILSKIFLFTGRQFWSELQSRPRLLFQTNSHSNKCNAENMVFCWVSEIQKFHLKMFMNPHYFQLVKALNFQWHTFDHVLVPRCLNSWFQAWAHALTSISKISLLHSVIIHALIIFYKLQSVFLAWSRVVRRDFCSRG